MIKKRSKLNKLTTLLLLPALIPIAILGWIIYIVGNKNRSNRNAPNRKKQTHPQ